MTWLHRRGTHGVALLLAASLVLLALVLILPTEKAAPTPAQQEVQPSTAAGASAERVDPRRTDPLPVVEAADIAPLRPAGDASDHMPFSYRKALGVLTGRVVDADRQPVPDLEVELLPSGFHEMTWMAQLSPSDESTDVMTWTRDARRTNQDGRFTLAGLEPSIRDLELTLDAGGPNACLHTVFVQPAPGEIVDLGTFTMERRATLRGLIHDRHGQPIPSALVSAIPVNLASRFGIAAQLSPTAWRPESVLVNEYGEPRIARLPTAKTNSLLPWPVTRTDKAGRYELAVPPSATVLLTVDHPDHPALRREHQPTPAAGSALELPTLVLVDGLTAEGQVIDTQGRPVPGVEVWVGPAATSTAVLYHAVPETDEEGRFLAHGLALDVEARVLVRAPGLGGLAFSDPFVPGLTPVIIRLQPETLSILVLDEAGDPLEQVSVRGGPTVLYRGGSSAMAPMPAAPMTASNEGNSLQRDLISRLARDFTPLLSSSEAGQFEIPVLAHPIFALEVGAPGHETVRRQVPMSSTHAAPLDEAQVFRLRRTRDVTVHVRAADGAPVEWAAVRQYSMSDSALGSARTDASGQAQVRVIEGDAWLSSYHPSFSVTRTQAPAGASEVDVIMSPLPTGSIDGVVLRGQLPLEGALVTLMDRSGPQRRTITDSDGRFHFENLLHGHWPITVSLLPDTHPGFVAQESGPSTFQMVNAKTGVLPGDLTIIQLGDEPEGWLQGTLTVNGHSAIGWRLQMQDEARDVRLIEISPAGGFEVGAVNPGASVQLWAIPPSRSSSFPCAVLEVTPGDRRAGPITWDLSTYSVEGSVLPGGSRGPTADLEVTLNPVGMRWLVASTRTDAAGHFRVEQMPAGDYELMLGGTGDTGVGESGSHRSRSIHVPTTGDVELRLDD